MTRIFTDGAEMGDVLFFDTANCVVDTTYKRSGNYSYKFVNTAATKNISATSEAYLRFGFRLGSVSQTLDLASFRNGTTIQCKMSFSAPLAKLYYTHAVVVTGTYSVLPSTWYLLEMYYKEADAGGLFVAKIDGQIDANTPSGDTKPSTQTSFDNIWWGTSSSIQMNIDDLALNSTAGTTNNGWCGDGHIKLVSPISDGDSLQLTCSTGTSHYVLVDEIPSNTTDYVEGATGTSYYDLYGVGSSELTGVNITGVWVESRALSTAAVGANAKLLIKTGGYLAESSAIPLLTTYTKQILGTFYEKNPRTSGTWSVNDLDTMQIGGRVP